MSTLRIAVVIGSTRPARKGEAVGRWVLEHATARDDATFELVDLAEVDLPPLDEEAPPSTGQYTQPHTRAWADRVASYDGFVFVTPEYNHGYPGSLKNALDRVWAEWNDKAAGFVSYGADGGIRSVEQLRPVMATLKIADVRSQVSLRLVEDFRDMVELAPRDFQTEALATMLGEVVAWAGALHGLRSPSSDQ